MEGASAAGGMSPEIRVDTWSMPPFRTFLSSPMCELSADAIAESGAGAVYFGAPVDSQGFPDRPGAVLGPDACRRESLVDMGATIQLYRECLGGLPCRFGQRNFKHSAVVSGPTLLRGADIQVPDLRGGFSYLIAALAAEGQSKVHGIELIYRGYERFSEKLDSLGADYEVG